MTDSSLVVFFIFFSILFKIVGVQIRKYLSIPIPLSLLTIGIILRLLSPYTSLKPLANMIDLIPPQTVLIVIMPCLVFKGSMSTDWHIFKKELGQIIPMSTSVVIFSSFFQSIIIKYFIEYDLSWNQSILLGILFSSTDNATTKDIMKHIHIESSLYCLLSGETIINQATVITLFFILNNSPTAISDIGISIYTFFWKIGLGFLVGIGFSCIMGRAMKLIVNDYIQ